MTVREKLLEIDEQKLLGGRSQVEPIDDYLLTAWKIEVKEEPEVEGLKLVIDLGVDGEGEHALWRGTSRRGWILENKLRNYCT